MDPLVGKRGLAELLRPLALVREPRITLVRSGGLGDTLLLLPALQWLRERLPAARLTLVGSAWAEALRPLIPFPLEVARFDSPRLVRLFVGESPGDMPTFFRAADAVILYTSDPGSLFVRNASRACTGPVVVWPVSPPPGRHATAHLLEPLAALRLDVADLPAPAPDVPAAVRDWGRRWLDERLGPGVQPTAIHPGSGGRRKCWPPDRFAELVERLPSPLLLLRGPADHGLCQDLQQRLQPATRLAVADALGLPEVAALLVHCVRYVGNDSGITHLAGALGVPTLAIFGPSDPAVWAPLGTQVTLVSPSSGADWPTVEEVVRAMRNAE